MGYALPSNRHVCVANHRCVFLDVAKDRYFCLPPEFEALFQGLLAGTEPPCAESREIDRLIQMGVIVPSDTHGLGTTIEPVVVRTSSRLDGSLPAPNPWHIIRAVYTQRKATYDLTHISLQRVLDRLRKAKSKGKCGPVPSPVPSGYVSAYQCATRILSTQDQCLRTAVGFTKLLNRDGYYPDLVIGVRMSPFRAHAWVQDQGTILTDTLDTVLPFTPILVI